MAAVAADASINQLTALVSHQLQHIGNVGGGIITHVVLDRVDGAQHTGGSCSGRQHSTARWAARSRACRAGVVSQQLVAVILRGLLLSAVSLLPCTFWPEGTKTQYLSHVEAAGKRQADCSAVK